MHMSKIGRLTMAISAITTFGVAALAYSPPALAMVQPPIGKRAPDFSARGADGKLHKLSDYRGSTVVLEWTSPICEFTAQQYDTGNMQRLQSFAAQHKIVWLSIDTAARDKASYLSPSAAVALTKKRGAQITSFLFDTRGTVGRLYGATSTPTVYVVNASGNLVYAGPVSAAWGDPRTTKNYVKDALAQVVAGKSVSNPLVRQYGCPIKY